MKLSTLLPLSAAAATASGSVLPRDGSKIQWGPCTDFNSTVPIQCGNLSVPLDYTNPNSTETLQLQLLKVPATKTPSKGSILFNFGGPGEPGRAYMALTGPGISVLLGGYHDLISWDTRGTGKALPISCYPSQAERVASILASPLFGNASDVAYGRLWADGTNYALTCQNATSKIGGLVGTAFTARDMMQIVDAVEDDGLLRYWGFSYGTVLGATVAALFPDRIDRIVIDGVQNIHQYYHSYDEDMVDSTDETWNEFFRGCLAAGRKNCALAREGATFEQLRETVYDLLYKLKYDPVPLGGFVIDYAIAKAGIVNAMYSPTRWPALARVINGLLTGNVTAVAEFLAGEGGSGDGSRAPAGESTQGIRCSDKTARAAKRADIMPAMNEVARRSRLFGDFWALTEMQCAQWRTPAKEIYRGDFRVKTKHPMLVVGNTWDPLTPLISARNASETFEGSVLLEHRGHGHCSLAEIGSCTAQVIRAYFVNGTLPEKGTVCEVESKLFEAPAAPGAQIGLPSKREASGDLALRRAAEDVSLAWSRRRLV